MTLQLCKPVHFAEWGIQVTTPKVTDELATVKVLATIENHGDQPVPAIIEISACDPDGNACTSPIKRTITLHSGPNSVEQNIDIDHPNRWDVDSPNLYAVSTKIEQVDVVVDSQRTKFGIRSCEFTADDGFHLNGRRLQLHGVNLHHDLGALAHRVQSTGHGATARDNAQYGC